MGFKSAYGAVAVIHRNHLRASLAPEIGMGDTVMISLLLFA
jgi:hypothetical protein